MCEVNPVFRYPDAVQTRRHGPFGYLDYKRFKPWLRDEFAFRCVYCLMRERWFPNGANSFGVDHRIPQSQRSDLVCDYDNLLYVCANCNSAKGARETIDPCAERLSAHVFVGDDGVFRHLSKEGEQLIKEVYLNDPVMVEWRRKFIAQLKRWRDRNDQQSIDENLGFPGDLPDLSKLKCENSRPEGVNRSYFNQRLERTLPYRY